ncbi:hypothetical protein ACJX0J_000104 [Zea mays]
MPLERSEVIRAVIVRTRKEFKGDDGIIIRYDDNAAVIIDQKGNPKGTRVFGALLKSKKKLKRENINADMNKKGTVRVVSTNITENIVKILLREGLLKVVSADLATNFMPTIKEFLRFWAEWELLFFLLLEKKKIKQKFKGLGFSGRLIFSKE